MSAKIEKQAAPPEDLTLAKIRAAIPPHLLEQNTARSTAYMLRDFAQITVTAAIMHYIAPPFVAALNSGIATVALWALYAFVQGSNFTACWVVAHECGHRAFSPSVLVNDLVGMILHSALLVPYHPWRISPGNHHKHTNHLDKDTVFVPGKKESPLREAVETSPLFNLGTFVGMLTLGWPSYLMFNVASQKYPRRANHFEPSSPLFRPTDRLDVIVSDIALLGTLGIIAACISQFGFCAVACWYGAPYMVTNAWLVYITFMQHTDVRVPHYSAEKWNYVRGALATVDRNFGIMNNWLHHIHDSHVVHHLFSNVPHYHAIEITRKHIKGVLGEFYLKDNRSLLTATMESWKQCQYVVPNEGVCYFYK